MTDTNTQPPAPYLPDASRQSEAESFGWNFSQAVPTMNETTEQSTAPTDKQSSAGTYRERVEDLYPDLYSQFPGDDRKAYREGFEECLSAVSSIASEADTTIKGLMERVAELKKESDRYRLALESLTVGGSEYYRNPELCVKHIRERRESEHNAFTRRTRQLQSQLTAANEGEKVLREALEFYGNPDSYSAISFLADSPSGEFMNDFEVIADSDFDRPIPGKMARAALASTPATLTASKPTE